MGAGWLRALLKKMACYPRPIHGTQRHTAERERALILTVPFTIKYEVGHVWGGFVHSTVAIVMLLLAIFGGGTAATLIPWLCQFPVIYFVHFLPCCVQRLNRAQLYTAIEDFGPSVNQETTDLPAA